jgi:RimJ/RimL family protein N-acetyltransferase
LPGLERDLSDGTVELRAWRDEDVPALVEACRDPDIVRFTRVPANYTQAMARIFMEDKRASSARGEEAHFALVAAPDDALLGSVGLHLQSEGRARVGYFLAAPARGSGMATRAVRLLARWAFDDLAIRRLELVAATDNVASQRVAERAGFTREGVLRSFLETKDGRHDAVMFSLLPGELSGGGGPPD